MSEPKCDMIIFNDMSKDFSRCDKPGVVPYDAEESDDGPGYYCVKHAPVLEDFRIEPCKHEGCNEPGEYNNPDGQPVCKGHYIQRDAVSAAIRSHLANCDLCNEDYEVFCPGFWTAGTEASD
jgi:hypothetical protein